MNTVNSTVSRILLSFIGFIVLLATFIHFLQDYRKIVHGQDIIPTGYAPIVSRTVTSGDAAVLATDDEAPILTSLNHDENDGNNDDVDLISPAHPTPLRSSLFDWINLICMFNFRSFHLNSFQ